MKASIKVAVFALIMVVSCDYKGETVIKTYYPNDVLKRKYTVGPNGAMNGLDSTFGIDGTLREVCFWKQGKLIDSVVKFDYQGVVSKIGRIRDEKLTFYRIDGTIESEVMLLNGLKNGLEVQYDIDGKIAGFKSYRNNLDHGLLIQFNKDLTPKYIKQSKNEETGEILTSHYNNGLLKTFRTYDNEHNGYRILFHPNGVIKSISQIKSGKSHGQKFSFTVNGQLISKDNYEDGELRPAS